MKFISGLFILIFFLSSCASYEKFKRVTEEFEVPNEVFDANFESTWQAVTVIMGKYNIEKNDREAKIFKTRWIDNTLELNFTDSFASSDAVKGAKFKLIINVNEGYQGNKQVTKVTVFKRQLIERDFLQGFKEVTTDEILEQTILYRIGRIIKIQNEIARIDKLKEKEQLESF